MIRKQSFPEGILFELFEHVLIAFMLSGILWGIAARHQLVSMGVVWIGMVLTIVLLVSAFAVETFNGEGRIH